MTPTEFYQTLFRSGKMGDAFTFTPSRPQAQVGTMAGQMQQPVLAPSGVKGPFAQAIENATKAITGPLSFMGPIANATASETKRVGESADKAIQQAGEAVAAGAGGLTSGLRIGSAVIVVIVGVWLIVSVRKLF